MIRTEVRCSACFLRIFNKETGCADFISGLFDGVKKEGVQLYIASFPDTVSEAVKLAATLRAGGVSAEVDLCGRSIKAQMKYADKIGAEYAIVLGQSEVLSGEVKLKKMEDGTEAVCRLEDILKVVSGD